MNHALRTGSRLAVRVEVRDHTVRAFVGDREIVKTTLPDRSMAGQWGLGCLGDAKAIWHDFAVTGR